MLTKDDGVALICSIHDVVSGNVAMWNLDWEMTIQMCGETFRAMLHEQFGPPPTWPPKEANIYGCRVLFDEKMPPGKLLMRTTRIPPPPFDSPS